MHTVKRYARKQSPPILLSAHASTLATLPLEGSHFFTSGPGGYMLSKEENQMLNRVGPGTPGGELYQEADRLMHR